MLRSIEISPANDTRIEGASPTTNFRISDLSLGFGVNTLIQQSKGVFLISGLFEAANIISATLRLVPNAGPSPETFEIYAYAINNIALDLRNATWNSYNGSDTWTTAGGLGDKDSSSESRASYYHEVGNPIQIDVTEPIKSNLTKGSAIQIILTGTGSDAWLYHSLETASADNKPLLTVTYKSYQDSWRIGSPSSPSIPNL